MGVKDYRGPVEDFYVEKSEIRLYGRCYHPQEDPYGKYPAVLLGHEFASNMNSTSRYAIALSTMKLHIFVFDFTGSKGTRSYGRDDIDSSVLTEKEEMEIVLNYVKQRKYVDTEHIILGGCSQGGFVAALLAAEHKNEIAALLMYYPSICGPDCMRTGYMMGKYFDPLSPPEYIEMYRGTGIGRKFIRDYALLDPWKEMTAFDKPVLICHGTWDSIANITYSREAVKHYKDCTLVEIESGEHIFKVPKNFERSVEVTFEFLKTRLFACHECKTMI